MRFRGETRALLALGLGIAACGGTAAGDLFYDVDGGTQPDASTSVLDSGTTVTDSGRPDAGGTDASKDVSAPDVQTKVDLDCTPINGNTCDLRTEYCCRGPTNYECRPQAQQCTGLRVLCAEAADCEFRFPGKGEVCCGVFDQQSRVVETGCTAPDSCRFEMSRVVICNPDDDDPCPHEGSCQPSEFSLDGFYICK